MTELEKAVIEGKLELIVDMVHVITNNQHSIGPIVHYLATQNKILTDKLKEDDKDRENNN